MPPIDNGLRYLTGIALRRGVSGSRLWMTIAVTGIGIRALRRLARNEPEVLYRTVVRPGDRFQITTRQPQ